MNDHSKINRRSLLKWSVPVVGSVALPAHAQTSFACGGPPRIIATFVDMCTNGFGDAGFTIEPFDTENDQLIKFIRVIGTTDSNRILMITDTPFTINATTTGGFLWSGFGNEVQGVCISNVDIMIELEYCCSDGVSLFETYDLAEIIIAAAP